MAALRRQPRCQNLILDQRVYLGAARSDGAEKIRGRGRIRSQAAAPLQVDKDVPCARGCGIAVP